MDKYKSQFYGLAGAVVVVVEVVVVVPVALDEFVVVAVVVPEVVVVVASPFKVAVVDPLDDTDAVVDATPSGTPVVFHFAISEIICGTHLCTFESRFRASTKNFTPGNVTFAISNHC